MNAETGEQTTLQTHEFILQDQTLLRNRNRHTRRVYFGLRVFLAALTIWMLLISHSLMEAFMINAILPIILIAILEKRIIGPGLKRCRQYEELLQAAVPTPSFIRTRTSILQGHHIACELLARPNDENAVFCAEFKMTAKKFSLTEPLQPVRLYRDPAAFEPHADTEATDPTWTAPVIIAMEGHLGVGRYRPDLNRDKIMQQDQKNSPPRWYYSIFWFWAVGCICFFLLTGIEYLHADDLTFSETMRTRWKLNLVRTLTTIIPTALFAYSNTLRQKRTMQQIHPDRPDR